MRTFPFAAWSLTLIMLIACAAPLLAQEGGTGKSLPPMRVEIDAASVTGEQTIIAVSAVSSSIVYALAADGLIKSADGGSTWKHLGGMNGSSLFFLSEKVGLVYTTNNLYLTSDGGLTWRTLLYPYPYL